MLENYEAEEGQDRKKALIRGRGAQINTPNRFDKQHRVYRHQEGLDEEDDISCGTSYIKEHPRKIINKVDSPDIGPAYSMNPYQGCEHGCIYCYARNTHPYWGYSAGFDFESKILVKENAPELLEAAFRKPGYVPQTIMLSGNTDCYQPAERKYRITRKLLEVLLRYRHPVGIITKNALIRRDFDLIEALYEYNLVRVNLSITSLDPSLRMKLEPRTAHPQKRLDIVKELSNMGIPVNVMIAPVIPGLNNTEIPDIIKAVCQAGAGSVSMQMVRLTGDVGPLFEDWINRTFPDRADKVMAQIRSIHGGKLTDSRFGIRMSGQGPVAASIQRLFKISLSKHLKKEPPPPLNEAAFLRPGGKQMGLF